jgi:hypothetical protein
MRLARLNDFFARNFIAYFYHPQLRKQEKGTQEKGASCGEGKTEVHQCYLFIFRTNERFSFS